MTARRILSVAALCILSACSVGEAATSMPEPPATLEKPARLPWGDKVGARVGRLAAHVHDQLHDRYGAVRETHYVARDAQPVSSLERWYAARVGQDWQRRPVSLPPEEHGFAYVSGSKAFALGWLDPLADGRVPVIVMTYGGN